MNQTALSLLGLGRDEVVGRTTLDLGIWQDEGQRNSFLACLAIEGTLVRYPLRILGVSGRPVEVYVTAEYFMDRDASLLVTRFLQDPYAADRAQRHDADEVVHFLSRSSTKFLVDEGSDLYSLVVQELRTLIPHSLVVAAVYDSARSMLAVEAYSVPDDVVPALSGYVRKDAAIDLFPVTDELRASLLSGELFEVPFHLAEGAGALRTENIPQVFELFGVDSHLMIGLTWNGTIYGAVGLLVRHPDDAPNRAAVETFVRQASVALQRNERSRALQESLHEKETLLREIHHRVKNNLQIVASLLKLQGGSIREPSLLSLLGEAADRVQSMALVHTMLYDNRNLSSVDAAEFLRALTTQIIRSGRFDASCVQLEFDLQSIRLDPDHAVPIGLMVNELVTNALKYGMKPPAAFRLFIAFRQVDKGRELIVSDSGGALPADFKLEDSKTLGMQLVASLARQLRGAFSFFPGDSTVFRVCFPV